MGLCGALEKGLCCLCQACKREKGNKTYKDTKANGIYLRLVQKTDVHRTEAGGFPDCTVHKGKQGDACQEVELKPSELIPNSRSLQDMRRRAAMKTVARIAYNMDTRGLAPWIDLIPVVGDGVVTTLNVLALLSMITAMHLNDEDEKILRQRLTEQARSKLNDEKTIQKEVDDRWKRIHTSQRRNKFMMFLTMAIAMLFMVIPVIGPLLLPHVKPTRRIYRRGHKWLARTWGLTQRPEPLTDIYGTKHYAMQAPSRMQHSQFFECEKLVLGKLDRHLCGQNRILPTEPENLHALSQEQRSEARKLIKGAHHPLSKLGLPPLSQVHRGIPQEVNPGLHRYESQRAQLVSSTGHVPDALATSHPNLSGSTLAEPSSEDGAGPEPGAAIEISRELEGGIDAVNKTHEPPTKGRRIAPDGRIVKPGRGGAAEPVPRSAVPTKTKRRA